MPLFADEDRKMIQDNSEALAARGNWHLDPGSTYHGKINKKPSPRGHVSTGDVEKYYRNI
jgi:hypothetical protein